MSEPKSIGQEAAEKINDKAWWRVGTGSLELIASIIDKIVEERGQAELKPWRVEEVDSIWIVLPDGHRIAAFSPNSAANLVAAHNAALPVHKQED